MIKIGDREVIETYSLLVPKDETAVLEFTALARNLVLTISFTNDQGARTVQITPSSDTAAIINFLNWDTNIGTALKDPSPLLRNDKDVLSFMAANYRIGDVNHLHIQFLLARNAV